MTASVAAARNSAAGARAAAAQGRLEDARSAFRSAVAENPRDALLLVEAAVVEGQLGDLKTADRLLEKSLKLDPENADAWFNLGQVARERNLLERAVRLFRKALALDPQYPDAVYGLGEALYVQGKAGDALPWLDEAVRLAPGDAEIVHVRALVLDRLGRDREARDAYREVLRLQPDHVNATLNLAALMALGGDGADSVALVDGIEASGGVPPAGFAVAGRVLHLAGEGSRALIYVEKALGAGLNTAHARLTLADILSDGGDFDGAEAELRKVLEANRDDPQALYALATIKRLPPGAERPLLRQAQDSSNAPASRTAAYFALYHLHAQAGDDRRAFEMLLAANTLASQNDRFDVQRHETNCARVKSVYTQELIARQRPHGFDRTGPVFIFGMPRAGTTLTEQILAAHPDVLALGERQNVKQAVAGRGWPESAPDLDPDTLQDQGRRVYDSMFAATGGRLFATDKSPGNYMLAGAISCILPQARLVYVRRTPGDNALSLFERRFVRGLNYSNNLAHIGAVYRAHLQLMEHWIETCGLAVHTVDYDLLVQDPEPHIRRLLGFVGLEFRPECLTPDRVERTIRTSSAWQVRQPISAKSVGRWRRFEQQLEPFFRALEGA